jgi:hypothetical protein
MFNKIRNTIASFIATKPVASKPIAQITTIPEGVSGKSFRAKHSVATYNEDEQYVKPGAFKVSHLGDIGSDYLRDAIAQLGAWSALARLFAAYEQQMKSKRTDKDWTKYEQLKDEFHQWNAATTESKQLDDDQLLITLDKLCSVPIRQGNDQTDAIIARIRKCTVEEVQAKRIADADKATQARKEMLTFIAGDIWQYEQGETEAEISSQKVEAKAVQTIEWIANTWQGDPAGIAGELLLIEQDIKHIKYLARQEANHEEESHI